MSVASDAFPASHAMYPELSYQRRPISQAGERRQKSGIVQQESVLALTNRDVSRHAV